MRLNLLKRAKAFLAKMRKKARPRHSERVIASHTKSGPGRRHVTGDARRRHRLLRDVQIVPSAQARAASRIRDHMHSAARRRYDAAMETLQAAGYSPAEIQARVVAGPVRTLEDVPVRDGVPA